MNKDTPLTMTASGDATVLARSENRKVTFGGDRDCRYMRHTAQSLQAPDQFLHRLRSQLHHFEDGLFQSLHSCGHVLHFVHAIEPRDFLRRLCVADLCEPSHPALRPCLQSQRRTLAGAEQELG